MTTQHLEQPQLDRNDMRVKRFNQSLGPRSLQRLLTKYCPDKMSSASVSPASSSGKPLPSSLLQPVRKNRPMKKPVRVSGGRELGDLRKLGRELTKMERVHMLLDVSGAQTHVGSKAIVSRSQPNSAGHNSVGAVNLTCHECGQGHKQASGQTKLKDVKSKLRLVTTRNTRQDEQSRDNCHLPDKASTQKVVHLPLLQCNHPCKTITSEDLALLREARRSLTHLLYPQPFATAVLNFRFTTGSQPSQRDYVDSSDASSSLLTPVVAPVPSILEDQCDDTETASTYDADRVDSEQFDYVFDQFSSLSTESEDSTLTPESDTATFSARAQRPSTTDTVESSPHALETRASLASLHSAASGRQKSLGRVESWPPHFTIIPSWPSLDDPFRFQYFGRGVHRDIMRRLHRSRSKKRRGKQDRFGENESDQRHREQHRPHKLEVIVPYNAACDSQDTV